MDKKTRNLIAMSVGLSVAATATAYAVARPYRRDKEIAYRRLAELDRESAYTACGKVEYGVCGEGHPVLVIHGSAGGFDQALYTAQEHLEEGMRAIAPSRFGYLGAPLPPGATPKTQADTFVCLFDELGIPKAGAVAYSAGGPSAVQLALHYPERISALVLVSTAVSDKEVQMPPREVVRPFLSSDFAFWLLTHPLRSLGQGMFLPAGLDLSPEDEQTLAQYMARLLPMQPRAAGTLFDMYETNMDPSRHPDAYRLEEIQVPTLMINATDDPLVPYADAQATAERIPNARLVTVEHGGHLMVGNDDRVRTEISSFLRQHSR